MKYFVTKKIDSDSQKIEWNIFPEDFRIAAYIFLWSIAGIGLLITTYFGDPSVFENNAIKSVWGYNNLCVVFDYAPANYFLPTLWGFTLLLFIAYVLTNWIRTRLHYLADYQIKSFYKFSSVVAVIEIVGFCYASTIFAVSPEDSLVLHSLPFATMVAILSMVAFRNGLYYFYEAGLSSVEVRLAQVYVAVHLLISIMYVGSLINGLFGDPFYNSIQNIAYNGIVGRVWFITGMIFPIYFGLKFRKRTNPVVLISSYDSLTPDIQKGVSG